VWLKLWCRSQLWLGFHPWPRNFHCHGSGRKIKKKKKRRGDLLIDNVQGEDRGKTQEEDGGERPRREASEGSNRSHTLTSTSVQNYQCPELLTSRTNSVQNYQCPELVVSRTSSVQNYRCPELPVSRTTSVQK